MAYPTTFDSFTTKNPGDTINAAHMNNVQTPIVSLEEKLGTANTATALTASTNTALLGTGASATGYQVISLANTSLLSGTLPVSKGGTGATSATNAAGGVCILDSNGDLPIAQVNVGGIVQIVYHQRQDEVTCNTSIPLDNNSRNSSEGNLVLTKAITPKSNSNILKIDVDIQYGNTSGQCQVILLDSNTVLATTLASYHDAGGAGSPPHLTYFMTSPGTSEKTFNVRAGAQGDGKLNTGTNSTSLNNGSLISSLTIMEIAG